jgi:uncharacterized cupredoxin-like copper-binding protein
VRAGRGPARTSFAALSAAGILALVACSAGQPSSPSASAGYPRVIGIELLDFRFEPAAIDVRLGESVRIVAINQSDLPHELFIGSAVDQDRHHAMHATAPPEMQDKLDDGSAGIYVPARGTAQLTYRFDRTGELVMACHLIGHFEAGMVGMIRITAG